MTTFLAAICATRMKEQIAALLFANEKTLTLEYKAVQVQQGSNDCGLFAIAFATSLCGGENPVEINYKQHLLCSHLLNCVTKQEISVFPRSTRKRKVTKSRGTETFELFCQCRLPEQGRMIQCDHCQEWYHSECVTVPESIWKAKKCQVVLQDLQVKNCYRNDSSKYNLEQEIALCIGHHAYVMSLMWDFHL